MNSCKLIVLDEINIKFEGLLATTRARMIKQLEYFVPGARYSPMYKLGRWNGKESLMKMGGQTYLHMLDKLLPILEEEQYSIEVEDLRLNKKEYEFPMIDENIFSDVVFAPGHHMEGQSIILKEHQVQAANVFLSNRHGTVVAATSAGKTLITAALAKSIQTEGRSITVVPSKDLVTQTEADFKLVGLDCGVYFGDRKEYNKTHTICTWQSLMHMLRRTAAGTLAEGQQTIDEFINGTICLICDETHTAKADVLRDVLGSHPISQIPLRWGLTGTIPKEEADANKIICNVGHVIHTIKAKELQDKGILSNCKINVMQLESPLKFTSYVDEQEWLLMDDKRISYIAKLIEHMTNTDGNTLVLVSRIETGNMLLEKLNLPASQFVFGNTAKKDRENRYTEINHIDNNILIATYGVASTGISISRLFNVVLLEPGKSFVRSIQSIGRGLRKAKDKDFVNIYDICGTNKYSSRHAIERIGFYKEAQYPVERTKVKGWDKPLGDDK